MKLTTFSTAKKTKNETKWMGDSERTSKIKARSPGTFFKILPMSAAICIKNVLHGYEVEQYLQK